MGGKKKRLGGPDLFVSYAGPDQAWAEWVAWQLKSAGYWVEFDMWDWAAGDNVTLRMSDALDRSGRMLALWSPSYFERDRFTTPEWTAVLAERPDKAGAHRLVPVRVAEVTPPSVLKPFAYRDLFGVDEERARAVLLEAVGGPRGADGRPQFPGSTKRKSPRGPVPRLPGVLPPVWNVPRRSPAFTGRDAALLELRNQLCGGNTAVVQALHGMGGVGKTTLAIEYAHRFAGSYELVWWINAEQSTLIGEQFTALGTEAGWISADAQTVNLGLVRQRLRGQPGWLLVFDNAETPADVQPWLPDGGGHVLVTSRNPGWDQLAQPVPLPVFTRTESVQLLNRSAATLTEDQADEVAKRLGDLPLAVAQAAQVLATTGMAVVGYLELLDKQTGDILSEGTPLGYPLPLAAVVRMSVNRLAGEDPAACQLVELCAFLAPDPVPTDLFTAAAPETLPQPLADTAASALDLARSTGRIGSYGLARLSPGALHLHRLTQAIIRDSIDVSRRQTARDRVEAILAAARPDDGRDPVHWPRWAQLTPHVITLDPAASTNVDFRELACHASSYLLSRGDTHAGRDFAERLRTGWSQRLGPDDPQALFAAINLANADSDLGRYADAQTLYDHVYARRRAQLGDDHPDTLTAANNLAVAFGRLGQYVQARQLAEDTYQRRRRVLGDDHPDTLISASTVASALGNLGLHVQARQLAEDTYQRCRRVLGDDHPDTLAAAGGLDFALDHMGQYVQARQLGEDTYRRRRRVLGDDHPDTLTAAANLAVALGRLGQYVQARQLDEDTYRRRRRVLGDDHPDTLISAANLAGTLGRLGQYVQARQLDEDTYQRHRQVLGDDHPNTIRSARQYAYTLRQLGRAREADRIDRWIEQHTPLEEQASDKTPRV